MKLLNVMQALFLTVIISLPVFVVAEPLETPIEKLISELAEKPEHHQAIAAYYHQKAEAEFGDAYQRWAAATPRFFPRLLK